MNNNHRWGEGVYNLISWFEKDRVRNAKVLVAGAGALGNEILKNLALFGVGNIFIVDFDTIEYSNLTRSILYREHDADKGLFKAEVAAAWIREINPEINVHSIVGEVGCDVGLGLYRRLNVAIGGLDSIKARVELNRQCMRANVPWVNGGIENLKGEVSVYRRDMACYWCELSESIKQWVRDMAPTSCAQKEQEAEAFGRIPTTPVIASIIGAVEVEEAMKIIHEGGASNNNFTTLNGKTLSYDGNRQDCFSYESGRWYRDCIDHELWEPVIELTELSADSTIADALAMIKHKLGCRSVEINLRNDKFVDKIGTAQKTYYPLLPNRKMHNYILSSKELRDEVITKNFIDIIGEDFPYPHLTLKEVGIPYLDILQVSTESEYAYVELSHDVKRFNV